ncbi:MAG TPA: SIMPL domain-containing protein [Tepidiformaceae bacterium]|nr:SIMPL domain-containing protein [Tepidiformaceae bacterium]
MRARTIGAWGLVAVALAGAACSETGDTTVLPADNGSTGINVSAEGDAEATPDTGHFRIGVSVVASTVAEARDAAATTATAIIDSVKGKGVDPKDIQTVDISIYPNYDTPRAGEAARLVSYTMTNTVAVKVRDLERFSGIIDDAVVAGGDNARLAGVAFGIEDDAELVKQAREKAMAEARTKAEQLASLAGVKLGEPLSINESVQSTPYLADRAFYPAAPATGLATPIEPGTAKVVVYVNVRWAIEDLETGG